jgi:hypothetical protein
MPGFKGRRHIQYYNYTITNSGFRSETVSKLNYLACDYIPRQPENLTREISETRICLGYDRNLPVSEFINAGDKSKLRGALCVVRGL